MKSTQYVCQVIVVLEQHEALLFRFNWAFIFRSGLYFTHRKGKKKKAKKHICVSNTVFMQSAEGISVFFTHTSTLSGLQNDGLSVSQQLQTDLSWWGVCHTFI